jgi:hypothetical protein
MKVRAKPATQQQQQQQQQQQLPARHIQYHTTALLISTH